MIIKTDVEKAIKIYEQDRSCWRVGLFLYIVDYIIPSTSFYHELKNFFERELRSLKANQELSTSHIEKLRELTNKNEVGPNSINGDIVNLYDTISRLLASHDLSSQKTESLLIRHHFST